MNASSLFRAVVLLACFFLPIASPAANDPACKRVILTGDPDYPPFSWYEDGRFHGSAIEITTLALQRMRLPYEIRHVGSFTKVLAAARKGQVDLIAELKNVPERQAYLAFSNVPIFFNPTAVYTRADYKISYNGWEDLIGLRGGVTADNRFGSGLDEFIDSRLTVESSESIGQNFAKLADGKIDFFITGYYPALSYLIRTKRESEFKLLQPFAVISDNFIGWSKASPCLAKLKELDKVLAAMVRSGEARRILETNTDRLRERRSRP